MNQLLYDQESQKAYIQTLKEIPLTHIKLRPMFTVPLDRDTWLSCNGELLMIVREIRTLRYPSKMLLAATPEGQPVITPTTNTSTGIDMEYRWDAPKDAHVLLGICPDNNSAYMVSVDAEGTLRMPGIPNVYNHGGMCLGDASLPDPRLIIREGLGVWLSEWLNRWGNSPFNRDLWTGYLDKVLQFDPETEANKPLDEPWYEVAPEISMRDGATAARFFYDTVRELRTQGEFPC